MASVSWLRQRRSADYHEWLMCQWEIDIWLMRCMQRHLIIRNKVRPIESGGGGIARGRASSCLDKQVDIDITEPPQVSWPLRQRWSVLFGRWWPLAGLESWSSAVVSSFCFWWQHWPRSKARMWRILMRTKVGVWGHFLATSVSRVVYSRQPNIGLAREFWWFVRMHWGNLLNK